MYLDIPQMLLIGSTGRNSGKTTLAVAMIQQWKEKFPVIGLKITTVQDGERSCPRGGEGCGACSSLKGEFEIKEERNPNSDKDTSLLLAAGADKVFWLKAYKDHLDAGIKAIMKRVPPESLIICESNSLRQVVKPGAFIMLNNAKNRSIKQSAAAVMAKVDMLVNHESCFDIVDIIQRIDIDKSQSNIKIRVKR